MNKIKISVFLCILLLAGCAAPQIKTQEGGAANISTESNFLTVTFKGDVTFDYNSAEVKTELYSEVDRVAGVLTQNPNTYIRIEGHTDSIGSDRYNLDLSKRRANAVKNLLVQFGIDDNRIEVVGLGKTMPITTNETEAGRQKNRRVEIKITPQTHTKQISLLY